MASPDYSAMSDDELLTPPSEKVDYSKMSDDELLTPPKQSTKAGTDWGLVAKTAGRGALELAKGAGSAIPNVLDTMNAISSAEPWNAKLRPPQVGPPRPTLTQQYQQATGQPIAPMLYQGAAAWPYLVSGPAAEAGLVTRLAGNSLAGAMGNTSAELAQQSGQGQFDPQGLAGAGIAGAIGGPLIGEAGRFLTKTVPNWFKPGAPTPPPTKPYYYNEDPRATYGNVMAGQVARANEQRANLHAEVNAVQNTTANPQLKPSEMANINREEETEGVRNARATAEQQKMQGWLNDGAPNEPQGPGGTEPPAPTPPESGAPGTEPTRAKAVKLRNVRNQTDLATQIAADKYKPVLDAKLRRDQYDAYYEGAINQYIDAEKAASGATPALRKFKRVVLSKKTEDQIRQKARANAGLFKQEVVHEPLPSDVNIIMEKEGSAPLLPYKASTRNPQMWRYEIKRWEKKLDEAQNAYEKVRDAAGVKEELPQGQSIRVPHTDKSGNTRYYRIEHRNRGSWEARGNPEQNDTFNSTRTAMRAQATRAEEHSQFEAARQAGTEANNALEPDRELLLGHIKQADPDLYNAIKDKPLIDADPMILDHAQKNGVLPVWQEFFDNLMKQDDQVYKMLGIGLVAGGQALEPYKEAEAATADKKAKPEKHNLTPGQAMTALGIVLIGAKSKAGREAISMAGHVAANVPSHVLYPWLQAAAKAVRSFPANTARLLYTLTFTNANGDVLKRICSPSLVAELETIKAQRALAMSGLHMKISAGAPAQEQQAYSQALRSTPEEIRKSGLTPAVQKGMIEHAELKSRGAKLLQAGINQIVPKPGEQLTPGQRQERDVLKMELRFNWSTGSIYDHSDNPVIHAVNNAIGVAVQGMTQAVQLGKLGVHLIHILSGGISTGARVPLEFAQAAVILATDKEAQNFVKSMNFQLPLVGRLEDTRSGAIDAANNLLEAAANKLTRGVYQKAKASPVATTAKEVVSGQLAEQKGKIDPALVAYSEKAANDFQYPGGGKGLRADLTAYVNRKSGEMQPNADTHKMIACMAYIIGQMDEALGTGAAGYKVIFPVDRLAVEMGGLHNIGKAAGMFQKGIIIQTRADLLLAKTGREALAKGDYTKARACFGAFLLTGIATQQFSGGTGNWELDEAMSELDPVDGKKFHDWLDNFAILGNLMGIRVPHVEQRLFWPLQASVSIAINDLGNLSKLLDSKTPAEAKQKAIITLAAQNGLGSILGSMSLFNMHTLFTGYEEAVNKGGITAFSATKQVPYLGSGVVKDGTLGYQERPIIGSHLLPASPLMGALVKSMAPFELREAAEKSANDNFQFRAEKIVKERYGDEIHKAAKEAIAPYLEKYLRRKTLINKGVGRTPDEEAEFQDLGGKLEFDIEHELDTPVKLAGQDVKPSEYWTWLLEKLDNKSKRPHGLF